MKHIVITACALVLVPLVGCSPSRPPCGTEPWVFDGEEFEDTTAAQFCLEWRALIDPAQADLAQQGVLDYCELVDHCELTTQQFYDICQLSHAEKLEVFDVDRYCLTPALESAEVDLDTRVAAYPAHEDGSCATGGSVLGAAVATCPDGARLVIGWTGLGALLTFHDAQSGVFVAGLSWAVDAPIPPCCGLGWWPARYDCPEAVVAEVLCGSTFEVGETIDLDR